MNNQTEITKKTKLPEIPLIEEITKNTEGLGLPAFAYRPPKYTRQEAVDIIRGLPNHVMQHEHGIYFESSRDGDKKLIAVTQQNYEFKADWLDFYLNDCTQKLPELQTVKKHYEPLALESLAIRGLIQKVVSFRPWINSKKLSVNRWWLACEWEICDRLLSSSGFLDDPIILGKRDAYQMRLDKGATQTATLAEFFSLPPLEALEAISKFIAKSKENYGFRASWEKYQKDMKSAYRLLRNSPLSPAYLIDGSYVRLSRGNSGRKRL
ncbi:hypothetical protein NIES25_69960 (plasmid) [Nostoc linckia NIES-25]|nr:hypothetical protein NIES25_69960 [Nostoc linckia NIES-25]